jgi:hypothetical protein
MSTASNPLMGSGWGNQPGGQAPFQMPLLQPPSPNSGGFGGGGYGNPGGFSNPFGANEINRNVGVNNIISGQMKNQLAPQFAQLMQQYGGQAGNFFQQLMNLGSPYYKQKQMEGFQQGVNQNQNATAGAQQRLASQGYGNSPSGANAAMIGGMQMQGSQNLAEQYLQNLFQNEQMQGAGAQGLSQLAGIFNPAQMLSGSSVGANVQAPPSFFQNFQSMLSGLGAGASGYGSTSLPGA